MSARLPPARASALLVAAACASPQVDGGTYLCGPEQLCPPHQQCNGPDNTCVDDGLANAFACDPAVLHEPDDMSDQAQALAPLSCPSPPVLVPGCLAAADSANWVSFVAPMSCPPTDVSVQVAFPIAFEQIGLQLWQLDGMPTMLASDGPCTAGVAAPGNAQRCVTDPITAGAHYGVLVQPAGGDCSGACAFNRYELQVQIVAPR